jgi:hypothetical protein
MIKTCLNFVCLLVLLMSTKPVSAQLRINLADKKYKIPEFNNTNSPLHSSYELLQDSECIKYHVLEPLLTSPYEFEVRCSYMRYLLNPYIVDVLKADKDSLWWEQYTIYRDEHGKPGATKYIHVDRHHTLSIFIKHNSVPSSSYSVLDSLIRLGLFTQPDISIILSNLKSRNVKLKQASMLDGPNDITFKIKVNQHYRTFVYNDYSFIANPDIKELTDANKLVKTFLYITSGQVSDL